MAKEINFNFAQHDEWIAEASMERMEKVAETIRDESKRILKSKVKGNINRPAKGPVWTERKAGAMVETIRVVKKKGQSGLKDRNIWVMAGNFKTWWAAQMEYGRGGWKGGAKSFLRPGMRSAESKAKTILESGQGDKG